MTAHILGPDVMKETIKVSRCAGCGCWQHDPSVVWLIRGSRWNCRGPRRGLLSWAKRNTYMLYAAYMPSSCGVQGVVSGCVCCYEVCIAYTIYTYVCICVCVHTVICARICGHMAYAPIGSELCGSGVHWRWQQHLQAPCRVVFRVGHGPWAVGCRDMVYKHQHVAWPLP